MEKYLYLGLNLLTISVPLIRSFEPRIKFFSKWKAFFLANIPIAIGFLIWDEYFTQAGVWGFNERYLSGIYIGSLPLEECLFFFTVPYASVFLFEVLNYFNKRSLAANTNRSIAFILALSNLALAFLFFDKAYTAVSLLVNGALLLVLAVFLKDYLKGMFRTYLIVLPGFFFVNGILTGSFIEEPVVWYNDLENMGLRMGTIPLEDAFYGMSLIFMNLLLYKFFKVLLRIDREPNLESSFS